MTLARPAIALAFGFAVGCSVVVAWPDGVDTMGCEAVDDGVIDEAARESRDAWPDLGLSGQSLIVSCLNREDVDEVCPVGAESCAIERATEQAPSSIAVSLDEDLPAQVQHELQHLIGEGPAFYCATHAPDCWRPLPCVSSETCFTAMRSTTAAAP